MFNSKHNRTAVIVVSILCVAFVVSAQQGMYPGFLESPNVDIRRFYSATGANGLTPDLGLAIANAFTKYGSGVNIDYSGICLSAGGGVVTAYGNTNPWHSVANSFSSYHRIRCNLQWITSVTLNLPSTGNTEFDGPPSSGNGATNVGLSIEPCVAVAGCGPNSYPQFPFSFTTPVAGTAVCAGPPAPACTAYTTGTAAFTNVTQAVVGVGTTWDATMVGGWMYSGTGAQSGACVGYIRSVNSTTSITLANAPNTANCAILATSGVQGTYTILKPNANVLMWVGSGALEVGGVNNNALNNNCFNNTFRQIRIDLEGLPSGIGKYTTNCQENYFDFSSTDNLNAGHQGASNHGFADQSSAFFMPLADIMIDNYYAGTTGSVSGGGSHESIYDVTIYNTQEPAANCGNGLSYGFIYQGWSFMNATSKGSTNNVQFSTINGNTNCSLTAAAYIDGARGTQPITVAHAEFFTIAGIHAGQNNKTEGTFTVGNAANFSASTVPIIWLDTNASTNNKACANTILTGRIILKDTTNTGIFNGAGTVVSSSTLTTACVDQSGQNYSPRLQNSIGFVNQTAKTASIATSTLCAATVNIACGQVGQYEVYVNVWGSGTACSSVTAGSVQVAITWTDENAVTHTAIPVFLQDQKSAAFGNQFNFNTTLATEGASGRMVISTNGTIIQYATTYVACTTGTGTYNLRMSVQQVQ